VVLVEANEGKDEDEDEDEDEDCKRSKLEGAVEILNATKLWPIHLQVFKRRWRLPCIEVISNHVYKPLCQRLPQGALNFQYQCLCPNI
jgi:hypothetical protein